MGTGSSTRKGALRFTRVEATNWRNFTRFDVALERRCFLVGANATGKSNFLDIFRFLHDLVAVGGGFQEAVRKRGGVSKLRSLAARTNPRIKIRVTIGDGETDALWTYELEFGQDPRKRPLIASEVVKQGETVLLERPSEADSHDKDLLFQTHLEQISANLGFRELAGFLASTRYFHVVPQLIREPDRSVGKVNDPHGGDFLERIARTSKKTQASRLGLIRKALQVAVPQMGTLELNRDDAGKPHLHWKHIHWRQEGAWQSEESFSDGTLRLLGLLWSLMEGTGPLLLEEPELSLHAGIVRHVPQMFAQVSRRSGRQIIVSTHSPELLQDEGIGLDEVLVLEPGSEGTTIQVAYDIDHVREEVSSGLSIGEALIPLTSPGTSVKLAQVIGRIGE